MGCELVHVYKDYGISGGARAFPEKVESDSHAGANRPFNAFCLGRPIPPDSYAFAVGELGCFDIGVIG
jgi:hypothetical protein